MTEIPMTDIAELFARDPLQLKEADLDKIIEKFRSSRKSFAAGNLTAGKTKAPTAKEKAGLDLLAKLDLKLDL